MRSIPQALSEWPLSLHANGSALQLDFDSQQEQTGIPGLLRRMDELGIG